MWTQLATLAALLGALETVQAAGDESWPQFRGPGARGVGTNPNLPDRWSASENVAWKREIAGRSWSSPIAWGERVFVLTAVSPGELEPAKKGLYLGGERPNAARPEHQWKLVCLDLPSGNVRWETVLHRGGPPQPIHVKNTFASETPVTDGERVYAYIGNIGVFCVDKEGRPVWSKRTEPQKMRYGWGTAASPVLHGERLFVINDNEERSWLMALDRKTGQEIWRTERDEKSNWSTPFVWQTRERAEIVTPGTGATRV